MRISGKILKYAFFVSFGGLIVVSVIAMATSLVSRAKVEKRAADEQFLQSMSAIKATMPSHVPAVTGPITIKTIVTMEPWPNGRGHAVMYVETGNLDVGVSSFVVHVSPTDTYKKGDRVDITMSNVNVPKSDKIESFWVVKE